jgi:hypothetical protein
MTGPAPPRPERGGLPFTSGLCVARPRKTPRKYSAPGKETLHNTSLRIIPPALVFGLRRAAVSWAPKGPEPSEGRLLVHFDFSPHQMISSSNLTHRRAEHDERTQDVAHHHRHARPPSSRKGRRLPSGYLAPPGCGCVILDAFIIVARSEHTRCFRHPGWLKRADDSFHFAEQPMPIRHSQS